MVALFSKLFNRNKQTSVLGIDIGSSAIKVVELSLKGSKAVLNTYGSIALGPYANEVVGTATRLPEIKLAEALTDVMREAKVTTHRGGVAIPFASSLVSTISMPNVSERQLANMVPMEARKYIPTPIAEVELDWSVIPGRANSVGSIDQLKVLIVAIHRNILERFNQVLERAHIEPSFFEIEIFSSLRGVAENTTAPTAIIDFGASSTKLYVLERGVLQESHTINRGSQDITQTLARAKNISVEEAEIMKRTQGVLAEGNAVRDDVLLVIDHILSEIKTMLGSADRKLGVSVQNVILLGGGAALKGLRTEAQKKIGRTVVLGNPFTKIVTPEFLGDTLAEAGPEFAVAVGAALRALSE